MRGMLMVGAVLGLGVVMACGEGEKASPVDCTNAGSNASYNSNVKTFLDAHCTSCHSESAPPWSRRGAPSGVNYDTYDNAKANALEGAHEVADGSMPEGKAGELSTADRCLLQAWVNAGTPQ